MDEHELPPRTFIANAVCHIVLSVIIMTFGALLFLLQGLFTYGISAGNWDWPDDMLPVGFIAAAVMLLPTIFSVIAAWLNSRNCLTAALVLCACGVIVSSTSGLNGIVHVIIHAQYQYAVLTVAVISFTVGLVGIVHMSVMCVDLCQCGPRESSMPISGKPTKQTDGHLNLSSLPPSVQQADVHGVRYPEAVDRSYVSNNSAHPSSRQLSKTMPPPPYRP